MWVVALFAVLGVVGCATTEPVAVEHDASTAVVQAPPCIHEVCAERPVALVGVGSSSYSGFSRYSIKYEHHCTCDRWGVPSADDAGVEGK
jgi:hypothetical protein